MIRRLWLCLVIPLALVIVLILVGMPTDEVAKQPRWPTLTLWQSPGIIIIFSVFIATLATYFIIRRGQQLYAALQAENSERQRAVAALTLARDALQARVAELSLLLDISHTIASTLELKPLVSLILDQLRTVVDYTGAAVLILDEDTVRMLDYRGPIDREQVLHWHFSPDLEEALKAIVAHGQPYIADPEGDGPVERTFQTWAGDHLHTTYSYLRSWLAVPLLVNGQGIGLLSISFNQPNHFTPDHARLAMAIAHAAAPAIENARLYNQAHHRGTLEERQRLGRELHDSVTQALYSITLYADVAARSLAAGKVGAAADYIRELHDAAQETLGELRLLLFELRPPLLEKRGLVAALQTRLESVEARAGLKTDLRIEGEERLPLTVADELYRIAHEALNNALKHGHPHHIVIHLRFVDDTVCLEVQDDGIGFERDMASEQGGMGLRSMAERAQNVGGRLEIESGPGQGTMIRVKLALSNWESSAPPDAAVAPAYDTPSATPHEAPTVAPSPIRILVVDDHAIVRKGIRTLLGMEADIEVVGEAGDGHSAVLLAEGLQPDVILMDLVMPGLDGVSAIQQITAQQRGVRILVLTSFASDDKVFPAIKAGALGYLLKDSSPADLTQAIRQVYHGESSLHPAIARKVLHELAHPLDAPLTPEPLTEREVEVLGCLAQGLSNKEIASRLVVSDITVRTHVSNILGKLHVASRMQAALYALRLGIVSLENETTTGLR